jgi:carbon-monoxide dehydrogenase large subunit
MGHFAIGQSVPRTEDPTLLTGRGRYVNDVNLARQAYAVTVRSPHAHARIHTMDTAAAKAAPGVLAVYTHDDIAGEIGLTRVTLPFKRPDGQPIHQSPHPGLVKDRARHVGDPVAFVVAETLAQAKDAAELVEVDYRPLPSITDTAKTTSPGAPLVWDDCAENVAKVTSHGDSDAVDAAFAKADIVVGRTFPITRVSAAPMELRGCLGVYDKHDDRYTIHVDIQAPHAMRHSLAEDHFHVPEHRVRVISGNVGGAFGMKGPHAPEFRLSMWASKQLGRPVKWSCERTEAFQSDEQARDNVSEAELALDKDGNFLALRVKTLANLGAYLQSDRGLIPTIFNLGTLAGVYTTPAIHVEVKGVYSNTPSTAPYRGAGRPEAAYLIETLIDMAARKLGMDKAELRRKNTIPADAFPFKTGLVFTYDCGAFEDNMDLAMSMIDYTGFAARREEAKSRGKLRGLGISNTIERASGPVPETVEVRFDATGSVTILAGTKDQGQGHDIMYKQLLSAKLGVDTDDVRLLDGDTDQIANGTGTFGSRSAVIGGGALYAAADKIIEKGKKIAAHVLEASEGDIDFSDGNFTIAGTDRAMNIMDVAKASYQPGKVPPGVEPGLFEVATYTPELMTFPNGCHAVEVEIDEDTGVVEIVKYAVVDDVGTVINPLTLKGQIHGGVAQGVGQALMENLAFDAESGQVLAGSFLDYCMPRADNLCHIEVKSNPVPTKTNTLGAKGAGEAGTVGALPAVMNAVTDALAPLGIDYVPMPATAENVWRAMHDAKSG